MRNISCQHMIWPWRQKDEVSRGHDEIVGWIFVWGNIWCLIFLTQKNTWHRIWQTWRLLPNRKFWSVASAEIRNHLSSCQWVELEGSLWKTRSSIPPFFLVCTHVHYPKFVWLVDSCRTYGFLIPKNAIGGFLWCRQGVRIPRPKNYHKIHRYIYLSTYI